MQDVCIPDLIKLLDILGDNGVIHVKLNTMVHATTWRIIESFIYFAFSQNLRNEEQVAIIQASTVLSLAEKVN